MRKLTTTMLGVALTASALLMGMAGQASAAGVTSYIGYGYGVGATVPAAETAATNNLNANNADCYSWSWKLVTDYQLSDGNWFAEVSEKCIVNNN